ncbi:MAG: arginyltransferase [Phycisphaerae bacterium]|nr:arginyltransferase [Phycisphaerae bacterium]
MDTPGNKPTSFPPLPLYDCGPHTCPYLEGRQATERFTLVSHLDGAVYQGLMDMGFRRSGWMVYQPVCDGCRECIPLRVPVNAFSPSRSQRRVLRRNRDLRVEIDVPRCTEEKWRTYVDYLRHQHDGAMGEGFDDFKQFLYESPTDTIEMTYCSERRTIAVGILDVCPGCLSTVYFYFDPAEARRSLGTFGALREIEECRQRGLPYWYAGFYIRQCRRMNYKAGFRPHELLGPDGIWRPAADAQ